MEHKKGIYEKYIKRILDFTLSLIALICLSPVLLIIAILVRVKLDKPIIFKQQRPGKDEEIFTLYKFRTMTNEKDENGELLHDETRLTSLGRFLRSTSLDELPELINIIKGDMSIVGPRPLLVKYLKRYNIYQRRRHEVRPGLTGLAQVSGRNAISWEEKFDKDIEYIDDITFIKDVKIVAKTVINVIKKDGICSENSVTMEEFMGNEEKEKMLE